MTRVGLLKPTFVEFIPEELEDSVLYVSMEFATAAHKCCCGCGSRIVTPITPTDWSITFDGVGVSLEPSVGNWSFPCRSHYWITNNQVTWAPVWTNEQIRRGRDYDRRTKDTHFGPKSHEEPHSHPQISPGSKWRAWIRNWLGRP